MKYEQIIALLEKGLTPEQITALRAMPDTVAPQEEPEAPAQTPEPPAAQETAPAWANALQMSIDRMTNALHANAIMQQQQPEVPTMTPEQALAEIIAPPKKK